MPSPDASGAAGADHAPAVVRPRPHPDVPLDLATLDAGALAAATEAIVATALAEDLADVGDRTSLATVPTHASGRAQLVARADGVLAGTAVVAETCRQVDPTIRVELHMADGDRVAVGDVVAELAGPLRSVLTAERTLLNLLTGLSGVATLTRRFADALQGTGCVVRDTRKTTPGQRLLEKAAVRAGGGVCHRVGLHDHVLVKENHVAAAGGVGPAARAALDHAAAADVPVHVQVEVTTLAEAEQAIAEGVVDLLLDNFTPQRLAEAVVAIDGRAGVEASGGITLETARAFAEAGADRLAVGALTHSAPALDLALDVTQVDDVTPDETAGR